MTIHPARARLVHELQDLYAAEQHLLIGLPMLVNAAVPPKLVAALREHLGQTLTHVLRLEECFSILGAEAKVRHCDVVEALLVEGSERAKQPRRRDAALTDVADRLERYQITAYRVCVELAHELGEEAVEMLLGLTLEEEHAAQRRLCPLADAKTQAKPLRGTGRAIG